MGARTVMVQLAATSELPKKGRKTPSTRDKPDVTSDAFSRLEADCRAGRAL